MKKQLTILSFAAAALCLVPSQIRALDAVPPTPPGGSAAPAPAADKSGDKPERKRGPEGPGGGRMDPAERLKMMTEKLGLTQEQQDKVKAIQEKNAPQFKELMAKGRENLSEEDKTKLRELAKSQMEEIGAILTPEQKEKAKEMRSAGDRKPGEGRKPGAK